MELFEENPELGAKLFKFMKYNSKKSMRKTTGVNFQEFLASRRVFCVQEHAYSVLFLIVVEVLTGEHADWHLKQYRKLGKHLLLAIVLSENYGLLDEKSFKDTPVSYSEALNFVKCLLKVFQFERRLIHEIDDTSAKVVIDGIFGN